MSDPKDRRCQTEFYWGCEAESSYLPLAQLVPPGDLRGGPGHAGLELRGHNGVGALCPPHHRKSQLEGMSGNYYWVTVPICHDIKWQSSILSHMSAGQLGITSSSLGLSGMTAPCLSSSLDQLAGSDKYLLMALAEAKKDRQNHVRPLQLSSELSQS